MLPGNAVPPESPQPPTAAAGPALPAADLSKHVPCLSCGYDLQGLGAEAVCPECALPASLSRAEDRRIPAPYLRALSWSVWLTLAPVITTLLAFLSPIADGVVALFAQVDVQRLLLQNAPLSLIPWAVGVGALASLRPPDDERPAGHRPRRRAAVLGLTLVTAAFVVTVVWLWRWPSAGLVNPFGVGRGFHVAWVPAITCGQTLIILHMLACCDIAARVESPRLYDSARAVLACSVPTAVIGLCVAMDLENALPPSLAMLGVMGTIAFISSAIGCFGGLLGVCASSFAALNRLHAFRKNLIRSSRAAGSPVLHTSICGTTHP